MGRGLEKAFLKENAGKMALSRETKVNKAESPRHLSKETDAYWFWRRSVSMLYTEDVQFWDPVRSHRQLFIAANSRMQQNQGLCFLAVKAGAGVYSNRY